jgi:hypothetical protein
MNIFKRSKIKIISSLIIALSVIGIYVGYNTSLSFAAVTDCTTVVGNLIQNTV